METLLNNTSYITANDLLRVLINECTELNPWLPIDENTPKDRLILLFDISRGVIIGQWYDGHWVSSMIIMHDVTHWQELPGDPD